MLQAKAKSLTCAMIVKHWHTSLYGGYNMSAQVTIHEGMGNYQHAHLGRKIKLLAVEIWHGIPNSGFNSSSLEQKTP